MPDTCDAHIRPFPDAREITCELPDDDHTQHAGQLRDYAYPGSVTELKWMRDDRRSYRGAWPGLCSKEAGCILPAGHPRGCHVE